MEEQEHVAVKQIEIKSRVTQIDVDTERANLMAAKELIGSCLSEDEKSYFIIMPYYPGQTLTSYLYQKTNEAPSAADYFFKKISHNPFESVQLTRLIISAVLALHEKGLIHRDLKPDNFIINKVRGKWTVHIIDLGTAITTDCSISAEYAGSFGYVAPETTVGKERQYSFQSDFYSLAVIIAEILTEFNYQQSLKELLLKIKASKFMRERNEQELEEFMPDVVDKKNPSNLESIEQIFHPNAEQVLKQTIDPITEQILPHDIDQILYRALYKPRLIALVVKLSQEDPTYRLSHTDLKWVATQLSSLEDDWTLFKNSYLNIVESLETISSIPGAEALTRKVIPVLLSKVFHESKQNPPQNNTALFSPQEQNEKLDELQPSAMAYTG